MCDCSKSLAGRNDISFWFFSKSGFTDEMRKLECKRIRLVPIDDMYLPHVDSYRTTS